MEVLAKITIFGATGGTGLQLVEQACRAGHDVTAVVREPAALTDRTNLTVVAADVTNPTEIAPTIAGRDAVLTAIGARGRGPTTVQTDTTTTIIAAMRQSGVRRLVCVSNSGMYKVGDGPQRAGRFQISRADGQRVSLTDKGYGPVTGGGPCRAMA